MNTDRMISHYFYSLVRYCILWKLLVQTGNIQRYMKSALGVIDWNDRDLSKYVPSHIYLLAYWCPQVFSAKLLPRPWILACTVAQGCSVRNAGLYAEISALFFVCYGNLWGVQMHQLGVQKQGSSITEVSSYFIFSSDVYRASVIVFPYKNVLNYGGSNTCPEWELEVLYKHHNSEVLSYFKQSSQSPITDSFSLTTGKSNKAIYAQLVPNNYILVSVVIAFPK